MYIDRDTNEAFMSMREFEELLDYSHSLPTGQTPGKVWKAKLADGTWILREYELYPEGHELRDTMIKINVFGICINVPGVETLGH